MADDLKTKLPEPPRLPQRAAIYLAPDGSVHFGALFEGLLPVARALGARADSLHIDEGGPHPPDPACAPAQRRRDRRALPERPAGIRPEGADIPAPPAPRRA